MNRESTFYIHNIKPVSFCNAQFLIFEGSMYERPFEAVKPRTGAHDYTACKNCIARHASIIDNIKERTEQFPLCCAFHTNLLKEPKFDKKDFGTISILVADKIIYTIQQVLNSINLPDWFDNVSDYIDHIIESFGSMPKDCGEPLLLGYYFRSISDAIINDTRISIIDRSKIVGYLRIKQEIPSEPISPIEVLISTYEKWLTLFPFEMEMFKGLKEQFQKQLPILAGVSKVNPYTGYAKVKLRTEHSLMEVLNDLTDTLLTKINLLNLHENGQINDTEKLELEFLFESRRFVLNQGYKDIISGNQHVYVKMIAAWFEDEKTFFEKILPTLKRNATNAVKDNPDNSDNDFVQSTIIDYLDPFKAKIVHVDFERLVSALKSYFETGKFPVKMKKIDVGKVNVKSLGWALNSIYRAMRQDPLPVDYLSFAKDNISTFSKVSFDKNEYRNSLLYKYFTTKTQ